MDFEVRQDDLRATRTTQGESRKELLGDGEAQLRVDRFGLTSNNVTYGVLGEMLGYWRFFPPADREPGWGRIPVWGYGEVVASNSDGANEGETFYGYFPMSTYVTMRPELDGGGFVDRSEHRAELPPVYNRYLRMPPNPEYADEMLLLRPLFATS
jgi:Protein of unknown function (DUF2855)